MKEILIQYKNGTDLVTIYTDGTKIREYDNESVPNFPETIDVKITNYCESNCAFCHESSSIYGKHANLDDLFTILSELPAGVELAIGGGNPLSHPNLLEFLLKCKLKGFLCNLTINQDQTNNPILDIIFDQELIKGLGISLVNLNTFKYKKHNENVVIHAINGLISIEDLLNLNSKGFSKFLILGYKHFRKGEKFYNKNYNSVDNIIKYNTQNLYKLLKTSIVSFDNLAIDQLDIKRFFTEEEFNKFYMGDEFTHSMYIDAVKQQYAPCSVSNHRKSFIITSLIDFFKNK